MVMKTVTNSVVVSNYQQKFLGNIQNSFLFCGVVLLK